MEGHFIQIDREFSVGLGPINSQTLPIPFQTLFIISIVKY